MKTNFGKKFINFGKLQIPQNFQQNNRKDMVVAISYGYTEYMEQTTKTTQQKSLALI